MATPAVAVQLRLPPELYNRLLGRAAGEECTVQVLIRTVVEEYLDRTLAAHEAHIKRDG